MSQEDLDFEYSAEKLVSADSPVVIVSDSIADSPVSETVGNIAEYVNADVLATGETWDLLSVSSASVTHVGPPSQNRSVAAGADVLLAVGYRLNEEFTAQVPVGDAGYAITFSTEQYTPEEYLTWCEEIRQEGGYSGPDWVSLNNFEENIQEFADAVAEVAAASSGDETEEATVYSSSDDEYPDPPEYDELDSGEAWRVAQPRKCHVCHTMTNKWVLGGYPSRGPRQYCPANRGEPILEQQEASERHEKHDELAELISRRDELESRLAQYDVDSVAGERTVNRLHDELEVIDEQIRTLRKWFGDRFDDVKGIDANREEAPAFSQ
jgi:hypothetical protein